MLQEDKIQRIPEWSRKYNSRWCDYVELLCLCSTDKLFSRDDFIKRFSIEQEESGSEQHSVNYDLLAGWIDDVFALLRYRAQSIPDFYPFDFAQDCISVKAHLTSENWQYILLLTCASIVFVDKGSIYTLTKYFEEYCLEIFRYLVSNDAQIHLFGTSRDDGLFVGSLRKRIEILAQCLGTQTTKTFDEDSQFDVPGGDEGIDLVAFNKLDDATHIPLAMGQCTCSYDKWVGKQEDISSEYWNKKIESLAPYAKYMFVPFYCRMADGKFEKPTTISTCLIDRFRILKVLRLHSNILEEIDVEKIKEIIHATCGNMMNLDFNIE